MYLPHDIYNKQKFTKRYVLFIKLDCGQKNCGLTQCQTELYIISKC